MKSRYLEPHIFQDLQQKMVFLGGPRQCGKTTLTQSLLEHRYLNQGHYFNWDDDEDKKKILKKIWMPKEKLLIFDEIHKYPRWKNFVKGIYDKQKQDHHFAVTGSARLDLYQKGGDSLLGRYHYWRLHPFDLGELPQAMTLQDGMQRLMTCSGFPEPFLDGSVRAAKRWRRERITKIIREDIRELQSVKDLTALGFLVDLLRTRVQGEIVYSNLAQDLQIDQKTVARWIDDLEHMYVLFSIRPFTKKVARSILRRPKVYFYDNGDVLGDEGAIFENLVATHLLKRLHFLEDRDGDDYELCYVRDKEQREVDFAVIKNKQLEMLIEVKWSEERPSKSLLYFSNLLKPKRSLQLVYQLQKGFEYQGIEVLSPTEFFSHFAPWNSEKL